MAAPQSSVPDFFRLFDLSAVFDIDLDDLSNRYRELARALHPDRFARGSDQERRLAAQKMASLNEAYQTLKDPLSRARYMLMLRGLDADQSATDSAFLVEQMELREQLESVRRGEEPFAPFAESVYAALGERERELRAQFAQTPWADATVRRLVQETQFLRRLLQQIQDLEESNSLQ